MLSTLFLISPYPLPAFPEAEKGVGSIARISTSISLSPELKPHVDAFMAGGGNFSGLVNSLLQVYFSKGRDPVAVDVVVSDVQNRLAALQEGMVQLQAKVDTINALKAEVKQNQEKQYSELSTLIEQQYDDRGEYRDLKDWIRFCGGKDAFSRAMKTRLSIVATKGGVPEQVAKAAILGKYPELEAYL